MEASLGSWLLASPLNARSYCLQSPLLSADTSTLNGAAPEKVLGCLPLPMPLLGSPPPWAAAARGRFVGMIHSEQPESWAKNCREGPKRAVPTCPGGHLGLPPGEAACYPACSEGGQQGQGSCPGCQVNFASTRLLTHVAVARRWAGGQKVGLGDSILQGSGLC